MGIKITDISEKTKEVGKKLKKNIYIAAALAVGLVLLLIPWGGNGNAGNSESSELEAPKFSLRDQEKKLEEALSKIEGAGGVSVVLTLKSDIEQQIAWDEDMSYKNGGDGEYDIRNTAVKLQSGSGRQVPVTLRYIYPIYQGALVITQSGSAAVKLQLTEAVSALTGLTSDKITVVKSAG